MKSKAALVFQEYFVMSYTTDLFFSEGKIVSSLGSVAYHIRLFRIARDKYILLVLRSLLASKIELEGGAGISLYHRH